MSPAIDANNESSNADAVAVALALADGPQPESCELLYRTYGDRMFGYCLSLCRDPELAAAATHDAMLLAYSRIDQLVAADDFEAWLLAIARAECLRQVDGNKDLAKAQPVVMPTVRQSSVNQSYPIGSLPAAEAQVIVDDAFTILGPGDRGVVDLSVWQDMSDGAIARVLGISPADGSTRVQRARINLLHAVTTLLLFTDRDQCADLDAELGTDEAVTPLTRRRVAAHLDRCGQCRKVAESAADVVALAGAPTVSAPNELHASLFGPRDRPDNDAVGHGSADGVAVASAVEAGSADAGLAGAGLVGTAGVVYVGQVPGNQDLTFAEQAARLDRQRPAFNADGFPRSHKKRRVKRSTLAVAALLVIMILAVAAVAISGL